ncbi:hypothetical protein BDA96_09G023700 [Sorghum bicolor]|uniref:Uncharacterized protein n=1 Tax=Sorghum bicolor TaxID=4558 RepID=A0A921U3K0_SORBI|nr:hypothetical protein BDA96_09G023700 [Sorghum bicolor]
MLSRIQLWLQHLFYIFFIACITYKIKKMLSSSIACSCIAMENICLKCVFIFTRIMLVHCIEKQIMIEKGFSA